MLSLPRPARQLLATALTLTALAGPARAEWLIGQTAGLTGPAAGSVKESMW